MRTQSRDTSPVIEKLQIARTQALSLEQKFASIRSGASLMAAANVSSTLHTLATPPVGKNAITTAQAAQFVARQYGSSLADVFLSAVSTRNEQWSFENFDLLAALTALAAALAPTRHTGPTGVVPEAAITGQLACALYGFPRPVFALDLLVDLPLDQVSTVVALLSADFLLGASTPTPAPTSTSTSAISPNVCFQRLQALHAPTLVGVNILIPVDVRYVSWARAAIQEVQCLSLGAALSPLRITVPSATVELELLRYRLAGERDDDAWNDILGILKVQAPMLQPSLLVCRSERLGLGDLMRQALDDAGLLDRSGSQSSQQL